MTELQGPFGYLESAQWQDSTSNLVFGAETWKNFVDCQEPGFQEWLRTVTPEVEEATWGGFYTLSLFDFLKVFVRFWFHAFLKKRPGGDPTEDPDELNEANKAFLEILARILGPILGTFRIETIFYNPS